MWVLCGHRHGIWYSLTFPSLSWTRPVRVSLLPARVGARGNGWRRVSAKLDHKDPTSVPSPPWRVSNRARHRWNRWPLTTMNASHQWAVLILLFAIIPILIRVLFLRRSRHISRRDPRFLLWQGGGSVEGWNSWIPDDRTQPLVCRLFVQITEVCSVKLRSKREYNYRVNDDAQKDNEDSGTHGVMAPRYLSTTADTKTSMSPLTIPSALSLPFFPHLFRFPPRSLHVRGL